MNTIIISYRLDSEAPYQELRNRIKKYPNWARLFQDVWIIQTRHSVRDVRDDLENAIRGMGEIFVVNITGSAWASYKIDKEMAEWIHENI
ncbi:MAG: hypothetical protein IJ789_05485 [Bacteroidales bacterium]|nr:hypothetical protein [Bacteroidales bacterium]